MLHQIYSTNLRRVFLSLLCLMMLVGLLVPAYKPALAASCTQFYTVRRGDTLASIGVKFGVSWVTLAKWNSLITPSQIFAGQVLCVSKSGATTSHTKVVPTFVIVSVVRDTSVTIKTYNFPANDTFHVLIGKFGTLGIGGIQVATVNSGSGGTFTATYNIPASLAGSRRLAIRLESPTSGFFAYNWFWNNTSTGSNTGGGSVPAAIPTFSISSVVRNTSVTVLTANFPANDTFNVYMGPMGTRGVGGYFITSINSGSGGTFNATFSIPAALAGSTQIAIRMESPTSGFFAYNWFWNNTAH